MTEELQPRRVNRKRLWLALAAVVALAAVLIVPPLVSVSRYKSRITQLISTSVGRPVRLASVEMRLLPRPGFVLTDLTVDEDAAYGAEPLLHANTVTASIRLLSLWRGRLEIDTISVDEASVNLVRTPSGRWNMDPLFRTAAAKAQPEAGSPQKRAIPLPYMKATNSRINIKNGLEKLPFSLVETDLSFWQENPGEWRIRLRGQPARTDLSADQADTGVVRIEASIRPAAELRQMPLHVEIDWREAQLGQLTRLVVGSDSGWRGDLRGDLLLDGTAEEAHIKTRLRAVGVHRAEFAPAAPLDFDANCGFVYHFSARALNDLSCDTQLGNGRVHLTGNLPGEGAATQPKLALALDRVPAQFGLDALRTIRSGFSPNVEAKGLISGTMSYAEAAPEVTAPVVLPLARASRHAAKVAATVPSPLTGSFAVDGFELSGAGLSEPIRLPKLTLEPTVAVVGEPSSLTSTIAIPAGGPTPLTVDARLALTGYQCTVRGQTSIARGRELARLAGLKDAAILDAVTGDPITVDLSAEGPWLPAEKIAATSATIKPSVAASDRLSGTVSLHSAVWKADYLANPVEISQATLHLDDGESRWEPIAFAYGPVKGTASLTLPAGCEAPEPCLPKFVLEFGELDSEALQAAVLGAHERGTMLSTLIERLHPSTAPVWPQLEGKVKADSFILGPVTLRQATATVRILDNGAHVTALDASLLGGHLHASGSLYTPSKQQKIPAYMVEVNAEKLSPAAVGLLVNQHWSGGSLDANGKVELSGFTEKDLAASAKGILRFDWQYGTAGAPLPAALTRFDDWSGDAVIGDGAIKLTQNEAKRGTATASAEATVAFGTPAKVTVAQPKPAQSARR